MPSLFVKITNYTHVINLEVCLLIRRCDYVRANNLCIPCLSKDHSVADCQSTYVCKINNCGEKHSSSLHVYPNVQLPSLTSSVYSNDNSNVYMPAVPVVIDGIFHTSALLDTGSTMTFCTKRLVEELKLQGVNMSYKFQTLHGSWFIIRIVTKVTNIFIMFYV